MSKDGGGATRIALLGTDYVYPRTTNRILRAFLQSQGHHRATSWRSTRRSVTATGRASSARDEDLRRRGKKTAIVSTINGDANVPFYRELGNQGIKATDIPLRRVLGRRGGAGRHRHPPAGRPPGGVELLHVGEVASEHRVQEPWQAYIKNPRRVTNDPMEATYIGFKMWAQAVAQAGTTAVDQVRDAISARRWTPPPATLKRCTATTTSPSR